MSTTISFTNYLDESVMKEEFYGLDKANVVYKEDDKIKKVEHFEDGYITYVTYYVSHQETLSDVREQIPNVEIDLCKRSELDNYTIVESSYYDKDDKLSFLNKQLYDEFGNMICDQAVDLKTKEPIVDKTEKYLFDNPKEIAVLSFEYKGNGLINYVWGDWIENTDQRQKGSIYLDKLDLYFPNLLVDYPYYKNANFLPAK